MAFQVKKNLVTFSELGDPPLEGEFGRAFTEQLKDRLLLKVCGMKHPDNIKELAAAKPDLMGLIFYPKSKRYVGDLDPETVIAATQGIKRVGVFVNETIDNILKQVERFQLELVQLHGDETPEFVQHLKDKVGIIKVFSVSDSLPDLAPYEGLVDYFLFDTSTPNYGGSGKQFNWDILSGYSSKVPFLLSGGVGLENLEAVKALSIPQLIGIDVNSKIELEPGLKDIEQVKQLKQRL